MVDTASRNLSNGKWLFVMPKEEMFTLFGRESNDEPFTQARAHHKHTSIAHLVKDYEVDQPSIKQGSG